MSRSAGEAVGAHRLRVLSVPALGVLVVGLAITVGLSVVARGVHERDEDRLIGQRVLAASAVLNSAVSSLRAPLVAAAGVAEETDGSTAAFAGVVEEHVGEDGPFVGASLWTIDSVSPLATLGLAPALEERDVEEVRDLFARAEVDMAVLGALDEPEPRLGYAVTSPHPEDTYVVYAETGLPPDRVSVTQPDPAFVDLDYALYLGAEERSGTLVISSTPEIPLSGRRAQTDVEFGETEMLLVMSAPQVLGSEWSERSWWLLLVAGLLVTGGAAGLTERLARSRARSRQLSDENALLYWEQQSIASKLQHSLLPDVPSEISGFATAARYEAGVEAVEIGGDWYDVFVLPDTRVMFAIGDVSGRGLDGAAVMASLRFGMRAYAIDGDDPATVLEKVNRLVSVGRDGHFATIVCGVLDRTDGSLELANAGHPPPLLLDDAGAEYLVTRVGPPVGVATDAGYESARFSPGDGSTLLCFTDGLVERRGETLDEGLARLRESARPHDARLDELLSRVLRELVPRGSRDDIAMLGVRWPT